MGLDPALRSILEDSLDRLGKRWRSFRTVAAPIEPEHGARLEQEDVSGDFRNVPGCKANHHQLTLERYTENIRQVGRSNKIKDYNYVVCY